MRPCASRKRTRRSHFLAVCVGASLCLWVQDQPPAFAISPTPNGQLVDVTEASGLDFVHFNGMTGRLYYAETIGSGGALIDFDSDGDLDVFLVQGNLLGADRALKDALRPWPSDQPLRDRLFRNDSAPGVDGTTALRFTDVTETSKILSTDYGIGATVGDIDNDGDQDLYVTNWGRNQLWRNRGDGTFEEVAASLGVDDPGFSIAATFVDLNQDAMLDLFVVNYVDFSYAKHKQCTTERGELDYCGPKAFSPQADRLYFNRGDDGFTEDASIRLPPAAGMGVVTGDFDRNGHLDLYVANDLDSNQLWFSSMDDQGELTLRDDALLYGAARNKTGEAEASMGLDAADVDADGDLDLFATHFRRESNTLYLQDENGFYSDQTATTGLAQPSWPNTGFGASFLDIDGDADLDLVVANGAVTYRPGEDRSKNPYRLDEPNQLFLNEGGRFVDASDRFPALDGPHRGVSRSVLQGDLDNDGDPDLIVTNNSSAAVVIRNDVWSLGESDMDWVGLDLRLAGDRGERRALGATLDFESTEPQQPRVVRFHTDGGYASASDPRVVRLLHTIPRAPKELRFRVTWPDGTQEQFSQGIDAKTRGRYHRIVQGNGRPPSQD